METSRKIGLIGVAGILATTFGSPVNAGSERVEICHVNSSGSARGFLIEVGEAAVGAHLNHGDYFPDPFGKVECDR